MDYSTATFVDEATGQRRVVAFRVGETILAAALTNGLAIEHTCGGVAACSTCHLLIAAGEAYLSEPTEAELDQLDHAPNRQPNSRLSCQATLARSGHVEAVIPKWNRNAVSEAAQKQDKKE